MTDGVVAQEGPGLVLPIHGRRRVKQERRGCPDRRATEEMARAAELEAARTRAGLTDPRELAYRRHAVAPLSGQLRGFESFLLGKGDTPKHAKLYSDRARRVAALACGGRLVDFDPPKTARKVDRERTAAALDRVLDAGRLADLSPSKVQEALAMLRPSGRGLQTLNHHRAAIRGFVL
jgi:hypothetical protein